MNSSLQHRHGLVGPAISVHVDGLLYWLQQRYIRASYTDVAPLSINILQAKDYFLLELSGQRCALCALLVVREIGEWVATAGLQSVRRRSETSCFKDA